MNPTIAQMRLALGHHANDIDMKAIGVEEAPSIDPKVYMPPDGDQPNQGFSSISSTTRPFAPPAGGAYMSSGMPVGGIDMNRQMPGQQLIPQPFQQQAQEQQMQMPGQPLGQPPAQSLQGPSSPLSQPQSNILSLTPQGQALSALKPPAAPQQPQAMAKGGQPEFPLIKIVKTNPRSWQGTGFGYMGATYGLPSHPHIQIKRESHGWSAVDTNDRSKRWFGTDKSDLEQELAKDLQSKPEGLADGGQPPKKQQTVKNAQRMAFPGVYKRPDVIAAEAAARVAPEDPALKQLFGMTRGEMYEAAQGREGMPHLGMLPGLTARSRGAESAEGVMTKRNEQRLIDVLGEAGKHSNLVQGMDPWYYMDPLFKRMVELLGMQKAIEEYKKMNALMGMASAMSEVNAEIPRGSAAYYLNNLGRFEDFEKYGGKRSPDRPEILGDIPGHMAHKTAQALPMRKFIERGVVDMTSPKVPMYIEASGVPETGFQTRTPVGDAHWSRAVGLADTRNVKTIKGKEAVPAQSVSTPEMASLGPWWQEKIAKAVGLESVPAQARAWGAFAPQTGVETPIGAPKLELIAKQIMLTAKRLGVTPKTARDMVLMGKERMGLKEGGQPSDDVMRLELTKKAK